MNNYNHEAKPLSLDRRRFLRVSAMLGGSALLWGCMTDRIADDLATGGDVPPAPTQAGVTPQAIAPRSEVVAASRPTGLVIPALEFAADCDGSIRPVAVPSRGDGVYYNPPTNTKIYWADGCSLPASPSQGTTYLFGHSDVAHVADGAVFDRLPRLAVHDRLELTTALGRFAYEVTANLATPYDELSLHTDEGDFGDGMVRDRLVLITCRTPDSRLNEGYNTVITARQTEAVRL